MSLYAGEDVVLPVDPSLASATLPSLTVNQDLSTNDFQVEVTKQSPSVVYQRVCPQLQQSY